MLSQLASYFAVCQCSQVLTQECLESQKACLECHRNCHETYSLLWCGPMLALTVNFDSARRPATSAKYSFLTVFNLQISRSQHQVEKVLADCMKESQGSPDQLRRNVTRQKVVCTLQSSLPRVYRKESVVSEVKHSRKQLCAEPCSKTI